MSKRKMIGVAACCSALLAPSAMAVVGPVPTASGATAPTWSLPYPQAMSYRVISQDRNVKCGQSDATFKQEVQSAGLDQYEITMGAGQRGSCGRLKAEQFKRLYSSDMVILYEDATAGDPRAWPGGTWPGYYLMMNRTRAGGPIISSQTQFTVADPGALSVGDTAVMWSPTGSDPFANSEWVKVKSIIGSIVTVTRNIFSTGVQTYSQAPFIAAAATGSAYPLPMYNLSTVAPVNPANGQRADQWLAKQIVADFSPSTSKAPTLDGVEFDSASWTPSGQNTNGSIKNYDCNADGLIDYCNKNVGTSRQDNSYGLGYDNFLATVKSGLAQYNTDATRPDKVVMADGEIGLRSLQTVDGAEFESYPSWDDYNYSSSALDTFGVWASQDSASGPHLSYTFTKDVTPVYPQADPTNPKGCVTPAQGGTCRNGEFRYGLVSSLVWGGAHAYNNDAKFNAPQPWDEEGTIDQSVTGLSPGYLGQPLGGAQRLTAYTSANLVPNSSYETDLSHVSTKEVVNGALTLTRDTTTSAPGEGLASLRADVTAQTADPAAGDAKILEGLSSGVSLGEYAIDFWAKGNNNAAGPSAVPIGVSIDGATGAPQTILLTSTWTHYYVELMVTQSKAKPRLRFDVGSQIGTYWLDGVNLQKGTAGIILRQFTNGIAVLNDSFTTQTTIALPGGPYHHINGIQDPTVNNGTEVGSTLPAISAKDGEILLRGAVASAPAT